MGKKYTNPGYNGTRTVIKMIYCAISFLEKVNSLDDLVFWDLANSMLSERKFIVFIYLWSFHIIGRFKLLWKTISTLSIDLEFLDKMPNPTLSKPGQNPYTIFNCIFWLHIELILFFVDVNMWCPLWLMYQQKIKSYSFAFYQKCDICSKQHIYVKVILQL